MSDIDRLVGKRILCRRIELGCAASDLAKSVGLTPRELADIEAGSARPSPTILHQISQKLDMAVARLFVDPSNNTLGLNQQPPAVREACNSNAAADTDGEGGMPWKDQSESSK